MKAPLVTLTRSAWRDLVAQAAGHEREGGGLLVGARTRYGNFRVSHVTALAHMWASGDNVEYDDNEVARARLAAHEMWGPLEPVGQWHTHPWPSRCLLALANQITDDWDEEVSDVACMLDGEVELIASVYPHDGKMLEDSEWRKRTRIAGRVVCVEVWLRVRYGEVRPCRLCVRG